MNFIKKLKSKMSSRVVLMTLSVTALMLVFYGVFASSAHAQGSLSLFGFKNTGDWIATGVAYLANMMLMLAAWWVSFTGMLLNVSINITLHIKEFVNSTPAIFDVWKAIRDISGLFIIFVLLYAAIRQILGISPPNFGDLIKNVVIAGILINFSFFMTGVLIDASNTVSLALYRAILPGQPNVSAIIENCVNSGKNAAQCGGEAGTLAALSKISLNDGGLSALFMQSLQVQTVYDPKNINLKADTDALNVSFKIILISITGAAIMIVAGLSFLAAAAAFIVRLVILIFLLAFSPIVFAASVVPGIDEYAKDWRNMLKGQLIFMPAYLLLMYAALLILSKSTVFLNGSTGGLASSGMAAAGTFVPTEYMTFAINAAFVIVMLNIPLMAAIKLGGTSAKWGMKVRGFAAVNSIGRVAGRADKYLAKTRIFGGTTIGRDIAAATTGSLKKSTFGAEGIRSFEDKKKANKESKVAREGINRTIAFNDSVTGLKKGTSLPSDVKDSIKKMSDKEVLALGAKTLMKPDVIRYLKKSQFDAIKKDDGTNFTDTEKSDIKEARKVAIESAANNNVQEVLKDMVKEYDGKEFIGSSLLNNHYLIAHLTQAQLKEIGENTDEATQDTILDNMDLALAAGLRVKAEHWLKKKSRDHEWGSNAARYP